MEEKMSIVLYLPYMSKRLSYIIVLFCIFHFECTAQEGIVQLRFSAAESNGKVFLDWTMNFGETCNGIDIARSSDSLNFTSIGGIQGICGSPTDSVRYSFLDESTVANKTNYYRLFMGNLGFSQVVSVEVTDLEGKSSQVRPNPISNTGRIEFSNDRNRNHTLEILSRSGQIENRLTTREEFFTLDASSLKDGFYIFRILDENSSLISAGKLVILK